MVFSLLVQSALFIVYICVSLCWGYFQEKISTHSYQSGEKIQKWNYPIVLNLFAAASSSIVASFIEKNKTRWNEVTLRASFNTFLQLGLSNSLSSTLGLFSLRQLPYPMLVAAKFGKQVPVMMIGKLFYQKKCELYQYFTLFLNLVGMVIFSIGSQHLKQDAAGQSSCLLGITCLAGCLIFDGVMMNEQDAIFQKSPFISSTEMMKQANIWQCICFSTLLMCDCIFPLQGKPQLFQAMKMLVEFPNLFLDVALYCICFSTALLLTYSLVRELGSFSWLTMNVAKQLLIILQSVFLFHHRINSTQWVGIVYLFAGILSDFLGKKYLAYSLKKEAMTEKEKIS